MLYQGNFQFITIRSLTILKYEFPSWYLLQTYLNHQLLEPQYLNHVAPASVNHKSPDKIPLLIFLQLIHQIVSFLVSVSWICYHPASNLGRLQCATRNGERRGLYNILCCDIEENSCCTWLTKASNKISPWSACTIHNFSLYIYKTCC